MWKTTCPLTLLSITALLVIAPSAHGAASELETLREELQKTQANFQKLLEMQQQTQRKMEELQQKLEAIEASRAGGAQHSEMPQTPTPATAAAPAPSSPPTTAQVPQAGGLPSVMELARPREPFALYRERGPGQLLFDMGVTGDFVGDFTSSRVQDAQMGTFTGFENRFFPREVEMSFFGQIDPYARAEVRVEGAQEFDNGSRKFNVHLAEANLTLQTLPFGTQAKLGLMRNRFGLSNEVHEHDLPQTDRPDVMRRFLGDEGLVETGAEFTWVPPLPFYLQVLGGVFNGDNDVIAGWGRFSGPLGTGRLRSFVESERYGAVQFGISGATGETPDQQRTALLGFDVKYKYTPEGWRHALVTVGGEALYFNRKVLTEDENGSRLQTRERWGMYTYAELRPWERWAGGLRFDWSQFPDSPGQSWALGPYMTFMPSEFLKFRLGYKYTDYSAATTFGKTNASEVLFQASFILGAHPAHPF
jgi:hypothetical protein